MTVEEIPVRRPSTLPNHIYYTNPQNRAHLNNQHVPIRVVTTATVFNEALLYRIGATAGAIVVFAIAPGLVWVTMTFAGLTILAIPKNLAAHKNHIINERLKQEGDYIVGEILTCAGGTGRGRSGFQVTTTYKFYTPTGMRQTGTTVQTRPDLDGKQLPVPSTAVYVLYFSDTEHYLL